MDEVEMGQLRRQLADYFCEDVQTFQLDECISTINTFTLQLIAAVDVRSHCYRSSITPHHWKYAMLRLS